ncbi:MAG: hypothetical protein QW666_01905 [Candidatus Woesearchaeota archaeon]
MKKTIAILALFILFSSIFVYAQTAPSAAEVVKRCLDAGKSRDECMRECLQYTTSDECERLLPKPSIFRRIADVFKPAETAQPTECCCAVDNKYFIMTKDACQKRQGKCTDMAACRGLPQTFGAEPLRPEIVRPGTCEMKVPEPVNPGRDAPGCEDCAVTVCFNMFHQEFLCLDGYKRCVEKYSFCRPIFCEPAKLECGSCPACPPCEQPRECCCQPYQQIMTSDVCISRQGKCADVSACREPEKVCCSFPTPTAVTYMPTPVPPQILTADICKEKGGTPVSMDVCTPATKECCCQPYKQVMKEDVCKSRQGRCEAIEACTEIPNTERTCCQYGDRFVYATVDECRKTQGLRTDLVNCETVCCKYPTTTTAVAYVPTKAPEKISRGACLKNGGTPTTMDACMPTIQPLPTPTITSNVCCEVRTGYYQMTPKDQCKRVVDDSYCQPKIATPLTTIARPIALK